MQNPKCINILIFSCPHLRCVLLPLLSVKPPQQSLFLLVDSIDEGSQLGEGEQRSSPGSPRTIAELLASHHEFLPPWLLLICSARRQNKAITKLFTGKSPVSSRYIYLHMSMICWFLSFNLCTCAQLSTISLFVCIGITIPGLLVLQLLCSNEAVPYQLLLAPCQSSSSLLCGDELA